MEESGSTMSESVSAGNGSITLMPYSAIVGQDQLKRALELTYVEPRIGGLLLSGERGTGKSTAVRAFAYMMEGRPAVTIPFNATEDRIVGGWMLESLLESKPEWKKGLLEEADGRILYIDEVNLLDDHIVNLILDVTATRILDIQRDNADRQGQVNFTLIGTMNPEEGGLRPQLLDRFGLMVFVETETRLRKTALSNVLKFEAALWQMKRGGDGEEVAFYNEMRARDVDLRDRLVAARERKRPTISDEILERCVAIAKSLEAEGLRGEHALALAARATAAIEDKDEVQPQHLREAVRFAFQHRLRGISQVDARTWGTEQLEAIKATLG
jgi:magnesium chelatase subunit I